MTCCRVPDDRRHRKRTAMKNRVNRKNNQNFHGYGAWIGAAGCLGWIPKGASMQHRPAEQVIQESVESQFSCRS